MSVKADVFLQPSVIDFAHLCFFCLEVVWKTCLRKQKRLAVLRSAR